MRRLKTQYSINTRVSVHFEWYWKQANTYRLRYLATFDRNGNATSKKTGGTASLGISKTFHIRVLKLDFLKYVISWYMTALKSGMYVFRTTWTYTSTLRKTATKNFCKWKNYLVSRKNGTAINLVTRLSVETYKTEAMSKKTTTARFKTILYFKNISKKGVLKRQKCCSFRHKNHVRQYVDMHFWKWSGNLYKIFRFIVAFQTPNRQSFRSSQNVRWELVCRNSKLRIPQKWSQRCITAQWRYPFSTLLVITHCFLCDCWDCAVAVLMRRFSHRGDVASTAKAMRTGASTSWRGVAK